jgi:hypothetical protein
MGCRRGVSGFLTHKNRIAVTPTQQGYSRFHRLMVVLKTIGYAGRELFNDWS